LTYPFCGCTFKASLTQTITVMKRLTFFLILFIPFFTFSQIIHIPQDYPSISAGIDAANPGDTIIVDEGTYVENLIISQKPVVIGSKFLITGDTSFISKTIIDGNQNGTVVTFESESIKPTIFTGLTITNGRGSKSGLGGGIILVGTTPELNNLIIRSNKADRGGGIAVVGNSGLFLSNSTIIGNSAEKRGGGIFIFNSSSEIRDCHFIENTNSGQTGGAIYFEVNADAEGEEVNIISNTKFIDNSCNNGSTGGVYIKQEGETTGARIFINNCLFQGSKSKGNNALSVSGPNSVFDIRNCLFTENEAQQYTGGGAFTQSCNGRLVNCLFHSNHAATGGADWNSGGATVWGGAEVDFVNCAFVDNTATYGAGLTVGAGGRAHMVNSIFWGNSTDQVALVDYNGSGGFLVADYCNIQYGIDYIAVSENSELEWGGWNTDTDPDFLFEGDYPCQLGKNSPCIDAGTPDTNGLNLPKYDLMGNLRFYDGDSNSIAIIDLGPYEYGSNPLGIFQWKVQNSQIMAYPNPFTTSTTIEYELNHPETVRIIFYNQFGKQVDVIEESQQKGLNKVIWTPDNLPDGIYYFRISTGRIATSRLQADEKVATGKLMLMR